MDQTITPRPRYGQVQRKSLVTELFGRLAGLRSPAAAHKRELQAPRDVESLLTACKERGALVRARSLLRRFQNILAAPAPKFSPDLQLEVQAADQMEDTLEHEFLVAPTPENRARWLRGRLTEAEAQERLTRALESMVEL